MTLRRRLEVRVRTLVLAALLSCLPGALLADQAGEYTFSVLKDGKPIGEHRFAFDRDGNRVRIEEETDIEVRLGFVPIFRFKHERRELWQDGRALRIDGETDDNGKKLSISVRPHGDGYIRKVNGRADRFDRSRTILAWWNKNFLRHHSFFSVIEDKILNVSFEHLGKEMMTLAGQKMEVDHYRMMGDENRDLWFDPSGAVAKVQFLRNGAEIEYRRNEASPRLPR